MTFGLDGIKATAAPWTEERNERAAKLWNDGLSASHIAADLGGVTRNAVIGKLSRMGLSRPKKIRTAMPSLPRAPRTNGAGVVPRIKASQRDKSNPTPPVLDSVLCPDDIPRHQRKSFFRLRDPNSQTKRPGDCRFPYGTPGADDFFFCGGKAEPERPYCSAHCRIAYMGTGRSLEGFKAP